MPNKNPTSKTSHFTSQRAPQTVWRTQQIWGSTATTEARLAGYLRAVRPASSPSSCPSHLLPKAAAEQPSCPFLEGGSRDVGSAGPVTCEPMDFEAKSYTVFFSPEQSAWEVWSWNHLGPTPDPVEGPCFYCARQAALGPHVWFCIMSSTSSTSKHKAQVLISSSVPSSSTWNAFYIKGWERQRRNKAKNVLSEEKKRTAKDMNATVASFNELAVAGGVLLLRKVEVKALSLIR